MCTSVHPWTYLCKVTVPPRRSKLLWLAAAYTLTLPMARLIKIYGGLRLTNSTAAYGGGSGSISLHCPAKLKMPFYNFPLQLLRKRGSKFTLYLMQFVLFDTYYWNMLDLTEIACNVRDLLWVLYIPARQCVISVSTHSLYVSSSHFSLLKWEIQTFCLSSLWSSESSELLNLRRNAKGLHQ